jgi:hypothetical protein
VHHSVDLFQLNEEFETLGTGQNFFCSQPLIVQLHGRECFLRNCKSLWIFHSFYVPRTVFTFIAQISTMNQTILITTFHSPIRALYQYYSTMYTYISQEASVWRLPEYFIWLLTYAMQHSPSWEADRLSASQEISRILWNPKVHCPPPVRILRQINPVHIPLSSYLHLGLPICHFSSGFPTKILYASLFSRYFIE